MTLTLGQIILVYGVVKAGTNGWSAAEALGPDHPRPAAAGLFVLIETRVPPTRWSRSRC